MSKSEMWLSLWLSERDNHISDLLPVMYLQIQRLCQRLSALA